MHVLDCHVAPCVRRPHRQNTRLHRAVGYLAHPMALQYKCLLRVDGRDVTLICGVL